MYKIFKTCCLFSLFCLINNSAFSQEPIYDCGEILTNENPDDKITKIIYSDNSGFYVLREGGPYSDPRVMLEKYDYTYKKLFSKSLLTNTAGVMGNSQLYRKVLVGNGKFYVFYDGWISKEQKAYYIVRTFNEEGDEVGTGKELETMKAEKQMNSGNYYPELSPDKSKLILLAEMPFVKETKEKITIKVIETSTWKDLWRKEITLENICKRGPSNIPAVDNQGNAYILKTIISGKEGDQYMIFTSSAATQDWKENILTQPGKIISLSRFFINNQGDAVLTALYSSSRFNYQGTVYARVNGKTFSLEANKWDAFGTEFMKNFMSASAAAKPDAHLLDLSIKDVFSQSDGKTLLVIEERAETSAPVMPGSFDMLYTVKSGAISVFCFSKDGTRPWDTVLKKTQSVTSKNKDTRFGSFACSLLKDKLYILWNNTNLTPSSIPPEHWFEPDGTKLVKQKVFNVQTTLHATFMWVVEPDGKQTYAGKRLFGLPLADLHKGSPFELSLNPGVCWATPDGIIVMSEMLAQAKRYRFCKIRL
jgi:outer membrane protein assembly factor BamB